MKTTQDEIRRLLDRYLDGETNNSEEQRIADFLAGDDVPDDLRDFKDMFASIRKPYEGPTQDDVKTYLYEGKGEIAQWLEPETSHRNKGTHIVRIWLWAASIAASVVLVFLAGYECKDLQKEKDTSAIAQVPTPPVKEVVRTVTVNHIVHDTIRMRQVVTREIRTIQPFMEEKQTEGKFDRPFSTGNDMVTKDGTRQVNNFTASTYSSNTGSTEEDHKEDMTINMCSY